MMIDKIII